MRRWLGVVLWCAAAQDAGCRGGRPDTGVAGTAAPPPSAATSAVATSAVAPSAVAPSAVAPSAVAASAVAASAVAASANAPSDDAPSAVVPGPDAADASAPATRRTFAHEGPPDWDAAVPEADPDCAEELTRAGAVFRAARLPVHAEHGITCGAPQVVTYLRGPGGITYDPRPLLTCRMALALASFERIVQDEATRRFKSRVARIGQIGTYRCRSMVEYKLVSEHSYANAIDLTRFTLEDGRSFTVLHDFDMGAGPPARPAGAFLRAVSQRADEDAVFSNVLTPFWDALHDNHFHLDLARYRVDGSHPRDR